MPSGDYVVYDVLLLYELQRAVLRDEIHGGYVFCHRCWGFIRHRKVQQAKLNISCNNEAADADVDRAISGSCLLLPLDLTY